MSTNDRTYYEQAGLWAGETADSADVIDAIMSMWPADAETALDVGCGNGAITNFLREHRAIVGGDFSHTALQFVTAPAVALSADALPFADGSFDLTMATDVFEHLPDEILDASIAEIVRVSRRYVFFCVPQHEPAQYFRVDCDECGTRYHAHHHQRPYDIADFASIAGTSIIASRSVGARWAIPSDATASTMRDWTGSSYDFPLAVCPHCETIKGAVEHDPATARLERRFESLQYLQCESGIEASPCRSELAVLLEKCEQPSDNSDVVRRHDLSRQILPASVTDDVDFSPARQQVTLPTYPDAWGWLADGDTIVLVVGRSPLRIEVLDGVLDGVGVYDAIDERYVFATPTPDGSFDMPFARPDARGYRVHLGAIDPTSTRLRITYRSPAQISTPGPLGVTVFGNRVFEQHLLAEPRSQVAALESDLAEAAGFARAAEEEAARAAALAKFVELETERADRNADRVHELYEQVQVLAAEREALNVLLNEAEATRAHLEQRLSAGGKK